MSFGPGEGSIKDGMLDAVGGGDTAGMVMFMVMFVCSLTLNGQSCV
jgi:hypothetical protein